MKTSALTVLFAFLLILTGCDTGGGGDEVETSFEITISSPDPDIVTSMTGSDATGSTLSALTPSGGSSTSIYAITMRVDDGAGGSVTLNAPAFALETGTYSMGPRDAEGNFIDDGDTFYGTFTSPHPISPSGLNHPNTQSGSVTISVVDGPELRGSFNMIVDYGNPSFPATINGTFVAHNEDFFDGN